MDARYFFIKDRLETEGIEVRYCPTEIMIADVFTKLLHGSTFKTFRDVVLGYKHISSLTSKDKMPTSQQRVSRGNSTECNNRPVDSVIGEKRVDQKRSIS